MDLPVPKPAKAPEALAALAAFVRQRLSDAADVLGDVTESVAPRLRAGAPHVVTNVRPDSAMVSAARQLAVVVVGAAAPFAPNAYARARLIRQLHATGLLTADEAYRVSAATALIDGPFPADAVVDAD